MSKKKIMILAAVVCLAAAVIGGFAVAGRKSGERSGNTVSEGHNNDKEDTPADPSGKKNAGSDGADSSGANHDREKEEQVQAGGESVFPHEIKGSSLTVQKISSYDGRFLEDGSDTEVQGIAAMLVQNTGEKNIEYADITVHCDGQPMNFVLSDLPAGASAVVQEKNKAPYKDGVFADFSAVEAPVDGFEMSGQEVEIEETENGALKITNLTDAEIPCVRIFYKFYMEEENTYVGGITYMSKVTDLEAGASRTVTPSHYSAGNSRVLMVRTYDTEE